MIDQKMKEFVAQKGESMTICPYHSQANHMCSVLVREVSKSNTWKDKKDIITAILDVRREEKSLVNEWVHLNPQGHEGNTQ